MHGGTSPGAPAGNQNARTHGLYCGEMREAVRYVRAMSRQARELVEAVE